MAELRSDRLKRFRAKQDKAGGRFLNTAVAVLLFLVVALPVLFLHGRIETMAREEDSWQTEEKRALLIDEINRFREDLEPARRVFLNVSRAVEELNLRETFAAAASSDQPGIIDEHLTKAVVLVNKWLESNGGAARPLFIVACDSTLHHRKYYFAEEFYTANSDPDKAAKFITFFSTYMDRFRLSPSAIGFYDITAKSWSESGLSGSRGLDNAFREYMGAFISRRPPMDQVSRVQSDLYNFGSVLLFPLAIVSETRLSGVLTVAYLEDSFSAEELLRQALLEKRPSGIRREIGRKSDNLQGSSRIAGQRCEFPWSIQRRLGEAGLKRSAADFELRVWLDDQQGSGLRSISRYLSFSLGLVVLFFWALMVRVGCFSASLPISLRKKLGLILLVGLIFPAVLTGLTVNAVAGLENSAGMDRAHTRLASGLDEFEFNFNELFHRQVLSNLRFKLFLTDLLARHRLEDVEPHMIGDTLQLFRRSFFYDLDGQMLILHGTTKKKGTDRFLLNNSVRFLNNLSGLRPNRVTRRHLDELSFTDGFAEGMIDPQSYMRESSCEAENIASLQAVNPLTRQTFMLLPDMLSRPYRPFIKSYFQLRPVDLIEMYVLSLNAGITSFFSRSADGYSENYAFALRDSERLMYEFWLDKSTRRPEELRSLLYRAMNEAASGNSISEKNSNVITGWRFFEQLPLIIAGTISVDTDRFSKFFLEMFPWFLVVFVLLILFLLTELMSGLFHAPVVAVLDGIKAINQEGNLNLRLEIRNNDEFDLIGYSFNAMTVGLLQKRHISRFVSSKFIKDAGDKAEAGKYSIRMTVLASDIRGFTSISEREAPEIVVGLLNDYFTLMESAITAEGGLIDRYVGDAIIAVFRHDQMNDAPLRACRAAVKMRALLAELNLKRSESGEFVIDNGIGIATGLAVTADIGGRGSRREFLITGEVVDCAESLEISTKSYSHTAIVIDADTLANVSGFVEYVEHMKVAGADSFEIIKLAGDKQ